MAFFQASAKNATGMNCHLFFFSFKRIQFHARSTKRAIDLLRECTIHVPREPCCLLFDQHSALAVSLVKPKTARKEGGRCSWGSCGISVFKSIKHSPLPLTSLGQNRHS